MDQATWAEPEPELAAQSRDPLAVALGNASLLSAGYVMLGRWRLAISAGLVTVLLVIILASVAQSVWFEFVVFLWWAAVTVHGWYLAGGSLRPTRQGTGREQRIIALAVTVPVLLAFGFLRLDAALIERDVAEARRNGDCSPALAALDRLGASHRVADAPLAVRGDDTVQACDLLLTATDELGIGLTGDTEALDAGFSRLATVLTQFPGHDKVVEKVLDGFLTRLPTEDACDTQTITDWLGQRRAGGDVLDRAVDVVPRVAPTAIVGCGHEFMADDDWQQGRVRYQQLLDQYPDHELAATARERFTQATQSIELANVRGLLEDSYADSEPAYCANPAPYSGAAPYRRNKPHRALLFGPSTSWPHPDNYDYRSKLPTSWLTNDAANAVLVICAGEVDFGARVETCLYESRLGIGRISGVTFRKVAIRVRVYEVRTGRLLVNKKVQIGGASCPNVLRYTGYGADIGPPSEVYVTPSTSDVRAAFRSLFNP